MPWFESYCTYLSKAIRGDYMSDLFVFLQSLIDFSLMIKLDPEKSRILFVTREAIIQNSESFFFDENDTLECGKALNDHICSNKEECYQEWQRFTAS